MTEHLPPSKPRKFSTGNQAFLEIKQQLSGAFHKMEKASVQAFSGVIRCFHEYRKYAFHKRTIE